MSETPRDECLICGRPTEDYEPEYCCSGYLCGRMGEPLNPCTCSPICEDAFLRYEGYSLKIRRIFAGISRYNSNLDTSSLI